MAEVLVRYDAIVGAEDGSRWEARACGRQAPDGMWEGWIEFAPADGRNEPVRSPRESKQPDRDALVYWAEGLTQVYLEGALARALAGPIDRGSPAPAETPIFEAPAPPFTAESVRGESLRVERPVATLDPYAVYAQGEGILIDQLHALDATRVRDIAVAFEMLDRATADAMTRDEVADAIVEAVRAGVSA